MIDWPSNPVLDQIYTSPNGDQWKWNGYAWDYVGPDYAVGPTGPTGPAGTGFIHSLVVFVDPNGNDITGEFGNMGKPFKTLEAALRSAGSYMSDNPVTIPSTMEIDVDGSPISRRYPARIEINVFPGLYISTPVEDYLFGINLMYNHIDWYFHPGAIVHDYVWTDEYNIIDDEINRPIYCNVYGHGTFISSNSLIFYNDIRITEEGSVLNMEGESNNYGFTVNGGIYRSNFRNYFMDVERVGIGSYNTLFSGEATLKCESVQWIYSTLLDFVFSFYQSGGKLDIDFKKYFGVNCFGVTNPDEVSYSYSGGDSYPTPPYWEWRGFKESYETFAPPLGYSEDLLSKADQPAESRIKIDNGKFFEYVIQVYGGSVEFYPGKIEIYSKSAEGDSAYFGFFGGPYTEGAKSKFILNGGIITFISTINISPAYFSYSEAIEIFDSPIVYIKDTQFIWRVAFGTINAIAYYGKSVDNQKQALILDGAKFAVKSDDATDRYMFYVDLGSLDTEAYWPIYVYNTVFSNLNGTSLISPSSSAPVVNLITGTDIAIDPSVILLCSDNEII